MLHGSVALRDFADSGVAQVKRFDRPPEPTFGSILDEAMQFSTRMRSTSCLALTLATDDVAARE